MFFRPVGRELVALLRTLPAEAWDRPTVAAEWRVRDVVAHLVDTTLRRLSFHRDGHAPPPPRPWTSEREFVAFINDLNREWVMVARRCSPRVLTDLYDAASTQHADFFEGTPMDAPALFAVSWAGESSSAGWFDIGREFTEQWHHQMQIRDAVGAPALADPRWLHAFLLIALRGLPHAYRETPAKEGDAVTIEITGPAGGIWTLRRDADRWTLWAGATHDARAGAVLSDASAWRLLFNALSPAHAEAAVQRLGDPALTAPLLRARSVIV